MENSRTVNQRKIKQWKSVIELRSKGLTLASVGKVNDISRQRVHQIIAQAKAYTTRHDDELAQWIKERLDERNQYV